MKLRIQVTVNGATSWSEWRSDAIGGPGNDHEIRNWVSERALGCLTRSLNKKSKIPELVPATEKQVAP